MDRAVSNQTDKPDLNESKRMEAVSVKKLEEKRLKKANKKANMRKINTGIRGLSPFADDEEDVTAAVFRYANELNPDANKNSYKMLSLEKRFRGHFTSITAVVCDKNGEFVITSSKDSLIKMWDMNPETLNGVCTLRYTFRGHTDAVTDICISYDNQYLFSCGDDKKCIIWCLETGRLLYIYDFFINKLYPHDTKLHEHAMFVSFSSIYTNAQSNSSSFTYCYFVGHLGSLMAIKCDIDKETKRLDLAHRDDCSCGDFSYNCCANRFVHSEIPAISPSNVNSVDISASGDVIALACKDNIIRMFKVDRFNNFDIVRLPHLYGHVSAVSSVEFTSGLFSSLPCVISCSNDGTVRVWLNHVDSVNYTEIINYNLRKQVESTLITNSTNIVKLKHYVDYENQKNRQIFLYRCNQIENPALRNSIHKKIIANYNNNNNNNILINSEFGLAFDNVNNNDSKKRMPAKLQTKKLGVTVTAFSDSLNKLCAACNDNSIVVLNFNLTASDSPKEVLRNNAKSILTIDAILYGHTDSVTSLDFHPTDEQLFASTGFDGRFLFWRIPKFCKLTKKNVTDYMCINAVDMMLLPFKFILSLCNKKGVILYDFEERDREHQKQNFADSDNFSANNQNNNVNQNNNELVESKKGKGGVASILFVEGGNRVISVDVEGNICVFSDYLNKNPGFVHSDLREYAEEQFFDSDVKPLVRNEYNELVCMETSMPPHLARIPTFITHENMMVPYEDQLALYNNERLCERLFNGDDWDVYDAREDGYYGVKMMKRLDSIMREEESIRMKKEGHIENKHSNIYKEQKTLLLNTPGWFIRPMVKGLKKRELIAAYENFVRSDALYYQIENTSPFNQEQKVKLIDLYVDNVSGSGNLHNITATSWYIKSTLYHVIKYSQNDVDQYKKDQALLQENIKCNVKNQQTETVANKNEEPGSGEVSSCDYDPNFNIEQDDHFEQMSGEDHYYEYEAETSYSDEEQFLDDSTESSMSSVVNFNETSSDEMMVVHRNRSSRSQRRRHHSNTYNNNNNRVRRSRRMKRPVDRNVVFSKGGGSRCKNSKKAILRNYKNATDAENVIMQKLPKVSQYVDFNTKQDMVYPNLLVDNDKFIFVQVNDQVTLLAAGLREYYMKLYESKAFIPMMSDQIFNWAFCLSTDNLPDLRRTFTNFSCDFTVTKVEYIIVPPMCVKIHLKPSVSCESLFNNVSSGDDLYITLYMFDDSYQYFGNSNQKCTTNKCSFDFLVDTHLYYAVQSSVKLHEKLVFKSVQSSSSSSVCEVIHLDKDVNNFVSYNGVTVVNKHKHYKRISPWSLQIVKNYKAAFVRENNKESTFTNEVKTFLNNLLKDVIQKEYASIFAEPVNIEEYYDYKYFVEQPMDLTKVLTRLNNDYYRSEDAFKNDLRMIESNAQKYNFPESIIVRLARALIKNMLAAIETKSDMKPIPKQLLLNSSFDQVTEKANETTINDDEFMYIPSLLRKRLKIDRETGNTSSNGELQVKKRKAYFMDEVYEEDEETAAKNEAADDAELIKWYLLCGRVYASVRERLVDLIEFFDENNYEKVAKYYKGLMKSLEQVAQRLLQCEYTVYEEFFQEFRYAIVSGAADEHVEKLTDRIVVDFLNEEQAFIEEKLACRFRKSHRITRNLEASVKKQLSNLIQNNDENYVGKKNRRLEEQQPTTTITTTMQKSRPKRETTSNNSSHVEVAKPPGRKRRALLSESTEGFSDESEAEISEDEACAVRKSARIANKESDVRNSTRSRRKNYNLRVSKRL